jgi:ubiquinone/menaquinone biosynthesis C-methylase UbiE
LTSTADERNAREIAYWNGPGGQRWLQRQAVHDALLAPVGRILLERAAPRPGEFVLDIGCGCGSLTIELAHRVGGSGAGRSGSIGHVLGVDVSEPMLQRARQLGAAQLPGAHSVEFVLADATAHPFEPARAGLLFSRFGVMFFAEPARAFANIRRGLRPGARMVFACWRQPRENPWAMAPLQQAYRHVPRLPEVGPEDPGPFSFANESRVRSILDSAGFTQVHLEPIDLELDLANGQGLEAAVDNAVNIGPASRALDGQPEPLRAAAAESIRAELARHLRGATVPLAAAIWLVTGSSV